MTPAEKPVATASDNPAATTSLTSEAIGLENDYGARNYLPLPVVVAHGDGAWVWDVEGRKYLDFLSAYSALNFGHRHPRIMAVARDQLEHLTLTSRAVFTDQLGAFERDLAELCGKDRVLPMNTGAEGVETAIKVARKWGYEVKGVAENQARIVVCDDNFHGRTTTIVGFSTDPVARSGFGPFAPGFAHVPYGDAEALDTLLAEDGDIVAFLFEPVQGEAGVIVPPDGYLRQVREICTRHGVLMIADEIQTGLGRTGWTFGCDREDVRPDMYILGKALGGGVVPLSAVVADHDVLGVLTPGTHGSTFGGNPLACAIGREVIRMLGLGEVQERSRALGGKMLSSLQDAVPAMPAVREVRGVGLWAGIELSPDAGPARAFCERLLARGLIVKDTHSTTLRLAPPLVIEESDLDWAVGEIVAELRAPVG